MSTRVSHCLQTPPGKPEGVWSSEAGDADDFGSEVSTEEPFITTEEPVATIHVGSSIKDVARWVRGLSELGEHARECAEKLEVQRIRGSNLFKMTREQLRELGFTMGDSEIILEAIDALRAGAAGSSAAAVGAASSGEKRGGGGLETGLTPAQVLLLCPG